jgi:CBS domain containing-hemolysin-like protein
VLLILSAFFSSAEIAYVVSNKIKIEIRARKNNIYAQNANYFVKKPELFFSTILISNNIVNIAFASLTSVFLLSIFHMDEYEILIITAILLLLFGKIIPKYIGRELADSLILLCSVPLRLALVLLYPLVKITSKISSVINRMIKHEEDKILHIIQTEDIRSLIEESSEAGKMDENESDIINKVIEIREQRVHEAITPRIDIVGVDITSSIDDVINRFMESGYSKLIVYEENLDNIRGMILIKDFFTQQSDWKSFIRNVEFVPETKKSLEMLNEFLEKHFSLAVVVDEFGGTAGIITMEDLIEELFGEIRDEYDEDDNIVRKLSDNTFIMHGKVEIDYLSDEYEIEIPEGDYETIAGYLTYKLGRIPVKGESFKIDGFTILVLKSDRTKIDLIKLSIDASQSE